PGHVFHHDCAKRAWGLDAVRVPIALFSARGDLAAVHLHLYSTRFIFLSLQRHFLLLGRNRSGKISRHQALSFAFRNAAFDWARHSDRLGPGRSDVELRGSYEIS